MLFLADYKVAKYNFLSKIKKTFAKLLVKKIETNVAKKFKLF
jgi:hypothetical protein